MARLAWLTALITLLAFPLFAQQPAPAKTTAPVSAPELIPRSQEERERTYQLEHRIVLNVFVTDQSGEPVEGLTQNDFTLLDNQQPQKITSFQAVHGKTAAGPVHVLLVIDTLNNSASEISKERAGVERFLTQNQGHLAYPVSIVRLSDYGAIVGQSSENGNTLLADLKNLRTHTRAADASKTSSDAGSNRVFRLSDAPTTFVVPVAAFDQDNRFVRSVTALNKLAVQQQDVSGRVLLIWVGPGWPWLNGSGFHADTPEIQKSFFAYIMDVSTAMREAQMTLDAVDSRKPSEEFHTIVREPGQARAADLSLPVLAYQSGGQILEKQKDIAGQIKQCIADADAYYVLSFDTTPDVKPDAYHSLQVNLDRPGLTARTIKLYYSEP